MESRNLLAKNVSILGFVLCVLALVILPNSVVSEKHLQQNFWKSNES
jgi:hypothetical protein